MKYAIAPGVAWVCDDEVDPTQPGSTCVVAPIPHGPPVVLEGAAFVVWRGLSAGDSMEQIGATVAAQARRAGDPELDDVEDVEGMEGIVRAFVDDLVDLHLVVSRP